MSMTDPKKLLAALAAIPPVALDDFLTETRRKAEAERKAEEARRKQAEAETTDGDRLAALEKTVRDMGVAVYNINEKLED